MNGDTFKQLFCIELIQYKTISIQNKMIKSNSIQNKMIEIKFDTKIIYTHAFYYYFLSLVLVFAPQAMITLLLVYC